MPRKRKKKKSNKFLRMLSILFALTFLTTSGFAIKTNVLENSLFSGSDKLKQKIEKQTVKIFSLGRSGLLTCSGVLIGETEKDSMVLTARHCTAMSEEFYVENNKVKYMVISSKDDLALLIVEGKIPNKSVSRISENKVELGDVIHHVGYPSGKQYDSTGKLTKITDDWSFTDLSSIPGCSGGGIFNNEGDLVGILWGGYAIREDLPYKTAFEPIEDISEFLLEISRK